MKRTISIFAYDDNGVRACLLFETEKAAWLPLDIRDVDKTKEFIPETPYELLFSDDIGSREFLVTVTKRRGFDIRRRHCEPSIIKEEFLGVSG
jgi:hypothetical protein